MFTRSCSPRTALMYSLTMEASLSVWALWSMLAREMAGWKTGAMIFTACLICIQGLRAIRAVHMLEGVAPELRGALVGMAVSIAGWLAMIILFTLITLYPELGVPMSYLVPAFLCHIGGALWAMHALKKASPDQEPED